MCVPKSVTPSRIQQNLQVFDFSLSDDDARLISSFDRHERFIVPTVEVTGEPTRPDHRARNRTELVLRQQRDGTRVWRDAEHPHFPFHDAY